MACCANACNFGNNQNNTQTNVESVNWAQITPLLMNADRVLFEKFKIDAKNIVTQDDKMWALVGIEWNFSPLAEAKSTFTIKPLVDEEATKVLNDEKDDTDTNANDDDDSNVEIFDFLSGVFKIYYDTNSQQIFGEVETSEAGLSVTYRYIFHFYGKQKVEWSDLLEYRDTVDKATNNLASNKESIINRVIAL